MNKFHSSLMEGKRIDIDSCRFNAIDFRSTCPELPEDLEKCGVQ